MLIYGNFVLCTAFRLIFNLFVDILHIPDDYNHRVAILVVVYKEIVYHALNDSL